MKPVRPVLCASLLALSFALAACGPKDAAHPYSATEFGATAAAQKGSPLVVGGFNEARGGAESLQDPAVAGLRAAISSGFKGSKFVFSGQLSAHFLARVNVVVLGVLASPTHGIAPLKHREQVALKKFVQSGGSAILFTDNDSFDKKAPAQNASLLAPFGLEAAGTLSGPQTARFAGSPNPVQTGPFGTAEQLDTVAPGWFTKLGNFTTLATFASNGEAALAYLPAHGGSGTVVCFSDASLMLDANRSGDDLTAILNALALAM